MESEAICDAKHFLTVQTFVSPPHPSLTCIRKCLSEKLLEVIFERVKIDQKNHDNLWILGIIFHWLTFPL